MQSRPGWSQLDELDRVSCLLGHLLDQRTEPCATDSSVTAQLFGVEIRDSAFAITRIDLDARDPVADLTSLAIQAQEGFSANSGWSWILVACETRSGGQLAVGVSIMGETLVELRSDGLTTLRSVHPASGALVDACTSLLRA